MPVAWNHRFAGSSIIARWPPPAFNNGLDPDTTEGAIHLTYALPNMHVEYLRVEPPGIPTAFWRSVGPSHNVFVIESFMDELAAAAKQDPVAYRRALLNKSPRAKAVLELAAEKAGWGQPLPEGVGRGVSVQFVFATYLAQVAEVEVSKDGAVRVRRVVCAVDCGTVVNPDTVRAQIQSAIIFGITAALRGEITLKDGRVEQSNFHDYLMLRMNEAPAIEVYIVNSAEPPGGMGEAGTSAIAPALTNAILRQRANAFANSRWRIRLRVRDGSLGHGGRRGESGKGQLINESTHAFLKRFTLAFAVWIDGRGSRGSDPRDRITPAGLLWTRCGQEPSALRLRGGGEGADGEPGRIVSRYSAEFALRMPARDLCARTRSMAVRAWRCSGRSSPASCPDPRSGTPSTLCRSTSKLGWPYFKVARS